MKMLWRIAAVCLLCGHAAREAGACTAIVAGKKASATGHVLIGHNEDVGGAFMRHAMLSCGDGKAAVFWSEAKNIKGGDKVAGCVYSERGVFVISNNGGVMREWDGVSFSLPEEGEYSTISGKGIGYDLRFRAVERAYSARQCVEIMIDLVNKHGYNQDSRNFLVADSEEAYILEVLKGRRYVARKVPDDEVVVYPNCLVFNKLRTGDIASENIKSKGADFDIIDFYQGPRTWKSLYNLYRWKEMYRIVAGVDLEPGAEYPFSVRPSHHISVDDIKRGLCSHYEGRPYEVKGRHPRKNPKIVAPVCRHTTVQSLVCEMNPNSQKTTMHLTVGRPCEVKYGVYVPFGGVLPEDTVFGEEAVVRLRNRELPAHEGLHAAAAELKNLKLKARTDKENPIGYKVGEPMRFDFFLDGVKTLPPEVAAKEPLKVVWSRTGDDGLSVKGTNDISLSSGFSVETRLDVPGMVRMTAKLVGVDYGEFNCVKINEWEKGVNFKGGAGAETERMRLATKEPDDFDAFWKEAKEKLARVPVKARLTDVTPEALIGKYKVFAVEIDCFGPRPATGWLTMPTGARVGSLPAKACFAGYNGNSFGVPKPPRQGFGNLIRLDVNAHGYEMVGHDAQYYKDYGNKVNGIVPGAKKRKTYALEPSDYDDPGNTYFYYMALRVVRAFDYLKTIPEWNGKTLVAEGGSQGGLQTMWAASLVDGLTEARPYITWGCDIGNSLNKAGPILSNGWGIPNVPGAFYFDAVLHARRVPLSCKVEITRLGLGDYTCPPRGVLLSYYNLKCPAKANLVQGSTHSYVPPGPNQAFTISKGAEQFSNGAQLKAKMLSVGESQSYYWAWTYPWLNHGGWTGDMRNVVKKGDEFFPKPLDEVKLECEYQKCADGRRAIVNYADLASLVGTWHSDRYYKVNRAGMTAAIKKQWREFGGVMVFNWHMDQPYCTNGFRAASYRFKSKGENRNVIRQILDGTGEPCGTGCIEGKSCREPFANPREWFMASLKDVADFFSGLVDDKTGKKIPVILRYPHEMDGDWFWWGRGWCTADEFRRFCRMEADCLREACPGQILFAYTPDRTWKDFGSEGDANNTFLAYYPGDKYVDVVGLDDYSIGHGNDEKAESSLTETIRKLRLMADFAKPRGQVVCISEAGGRKKRKDFWTYLHRAATAEGVNCAFVNTWAGEWGTKPESPEEAENQKAFAANPAVILSPK